MPNAAQAHQRKIVVVGGTSAIAEQCCRLWVSEAPTDLILVVRNIAKGESIAANLRARSPEATVTVLQVDFLDPTAIGACVDAVTASGPIDTALIAHGWLADQQACQTDLGFCRDVIEVNAVSPALFAEAFARHFASTERGTLGLIGSVAGDRARKANYTYGAAKGFLARYAEGMAHRFAGSEVKIVLIKPGPTDSPMTAARKARGLRAAKAADVARTAVEGMKRGRPVVYAPPIWRAIMLVARHLPRFLFHRLSI